MIHIASPIIANTNWTERVQMLFVRTLYPISHPLFMSCEQACNIYKTERFYTFNSCYDATPGKRFNNQFTGDFIRETIKLF
jgi:hypothetical protein